MFDYYEKMKKTIEVLNNILEEIDAEEFWGIDATNNDIVFCADYSVELRRKIEKVTKSKMKLNVKNNWYTVKMIVGQVNVKFTVWNDD